MLIISQLLLSCAKENFAIDNLEGNKIKIIGHGGMGIGSIYPMDSYESIIKCLSLGADGVEMDVQMTKDSVLVLFHNKDLSQGTNLKGAINTLLWQEIKNAYSTEFPYLNYGIISLDELFSNIKNLHSFCYTLDCKLYTEQENSAYEDVYIRALVKILDKYSLNNHVYIESSSKSFLTKLQGETPDYKLFIYPTSFETGLQTAIDLNLYGITISTAIVTKEQIKLAHQHGLRVAIWDVHSQSKNTEAIKKNPDIIQTDKVEGLLLVVK